METIQNYSDYVNKCYFALKNKNQQLKDVLHISFDLEKGLIESKIFEVFETDKPSLKKVLNYLRVSTESHEKEIEALMIKLNFLPSSGSQGNI